MKATALQYNLIDKVKLYIFGIPVLKIYNILGRRIGGCFFLWGFLKIIKGDDGLSKFFVFSLL